MFGDSSTLAAQVSAKMSIRLDCKMEDYNKKVVFGNGGDFFFELGRLGFCV